MEVLNQRYHNDPFALRAVSYKIGCNQFAHVRREERAHLFTDIPIMNSQKALELQSGSGYVSDGLKEIAPNIDVVCIEPSLSLAQTTLDKYPTICAPLESIPLANNSADLIFVLAGFHHSPSLAPIITEIQRILKSGGYASIAEVLKGSKEARWLNEYVDKHTTRGHKGIFISEGDFSELLVQEGFTDIHEERKTIHWLAKDRNELLQFLKTLFGLECSLKQIDQDIDDYLHPLELPGGYGVKWNLLYAQGKKHEC